MKTARQQQTGKTDSEAQGLPARPVTDVSREARRAARLVGGPREFQRRAAQQIAAALYIFGGRVIAVETQNT